jgi:pimeloyl-ACP methyl ester carboxylesterase
MSSVRAALFVGAVILLSPPPALCAALQPHAEVRGTEVAVVEVRAAQGPWRPAAWDDLDSTALEPGRYQVRFRVESGFDRTSLRVPPCAGRERVIVDQRDVPAPQGPVLVPLSPGPHDVRIDLSVSNYERRIACGERPRVGAATQTLDGFTTIRFPSPWSPSGGGRAVVFIPPGHDPHVPGPLLVGLHPWNGSMWTYAAYAPLLREARARDVVLLMPSGLGNSLYTAPAEDEVLRAVAAIADAVAVDPRAVSLWGASMGGAGATTIGFHHPDRFATVTSFFGDCKYDLSTYVRALLPSEASAHAVNALDVVDNARALPVWLVHGEQDGVSPIRQSEMLAAAMRERGWRVRFDRVPGAGHSGALVARFLPELVDVVASARTPDRVERMTYRSVRRSDTQAYGVRIVRAAQGSDAFIDVERQGDRVRVLRAEGVRALVLTRGALGTSAEHPPPIVGPPDLDARWEP